MSLVVHERGEGGAAGAGSALIGLSKLPAAHASTHEGAGKPYKYSTNDGARLPGGID